MSCWTDFLDANAVHNVEENLRVVLLVFKAFDIKGANLRCNQSSAELLMAVRDSILSHPDFSFGVLSVNQVSVNRRPS